MVVETQLIADGNSTRIVKRTSFAAANSSGSSESDLLVTGVSSRKIRVLGVSLISDAAVTLTFETDGSSNVAISGAYPVAANDHIVLPWNPIGWFETVSGEDLDLNMSGNCNVVGDIIYAEV